MNPIGTIRSVAMMLESSFRLADEPRAVDRAVTHALDAGWCTPDRTAPGARPRSTAEVGEEIARRLLAGA